MWLGVELGSVSYVDVEAHYGFLSSDIAFIFSFFRGRVQFCVVLVVSNRLFMPVNCLYCAEVTLSEL